MFTFMFLLQQPMRRPVGGGAGANTLCKDLDAVTRELANMRDKSSHVAETGEVAKGAPAEGKNHVEKAGRQRRAAQVGLPLTYAL